MTKISVCIDTHLSGTVALTQAYLPLLLLFLHVTTC